MINNIPSGWIKDIHILWIQDKKQKALLEIKNLIDSKKVITIKIYEQVAYYLFNLENYKEAIFYLEEALKLYPNNLSFLRNLSVLYVRTDNFNKAIEFSKKVYELDSNSYNSLDVLTKAYSKIGDFNLAKKSGIDSLELKDKLFTKNIDINLTKEKASLYVKDKKRVISFSLWGKNKRYLYGALRNLLLAKDIYTNWEIWIYLDSSVPKSFVRLIKDLGAIIHLQKENQSLAQKLCWRFNVANDPKVGYFIVRDIDSVISVREFNLVQQWIQSDKLFHIIRDWWTHTDLILAGLWGGVSGILPNVPSKINSYILNNIENPNIDQHFLRDEIWSYVKQNCLIYDRYFFHHNSNLLDEIPSNNIHIGMNEYALNSQFQKKYLLPWIKQYKLSYLEDKTILARTKLKIK